MTSSPLRYFCATALLPDGWHDKVLLEIDANGDLVSVTPAADPDDATVLSGAVLPGLSNLHSHAHQRAMAGLAERSGPNSDIADSFWSWRERMYRYLRKITPEDLEAIAAQLYLEMLKAGYTAVAEFQYLHHNPSGQPYSNPAELTLRCMQAAQSVGIGFTALPVLYAHSGFGGKILAQHQVRFGNDPDRFLAIFEQLQKHCAEQDRVQQANCAVAIAPHSLRAVTPDELDTVVAAMRPSTPIHIHIAEQTQEVEDCLAWSGQRPVDWLLDHQPINGRWCLVHATHLTESETERLARSGAVVGLCPTTEANLGDGLFPAVAYCQAGGRWGIGSDSHISVSPVEELRWLEYGQRLMHYGRNVLAGGPQRSTGRTLYDQALRGGAQVMGRKLGCLAPGYRADFIVLDSARPLLYGRHNDALLDSWIFAGNTNLVRDVYVGGKAVIQNGTHHAENAVNTHFKQALDRLAE